MSMPPLWAIATSGAVSVTAWPDPSCAPSRSASVIATASDYSKEVHSQTPQAGQGAGARDAHPQPLDLELSEGHGWPSNADWHRDRRPATRPSTQDEAARRANA